MWRRTRQGHNKVGRTNKGEFLKQERARKEARVKRRGFGEGGELEELQRCLAQKQKVSCVREREGVSVESVYKREIFIFEEILL